MQQVLKSNDPLLAGMAILLMLASCGKTDKPGAGTGTPVSASGGVSQTGGAVSRTGGASSVPGATGGSVATDGGREPQTAGASHGGAPGECIEGAACHCGAGLLESGEAHQSR